jgi:hypothetical protein
LSAQEQLSVFQNCALQIGGFQMDPVSAAIVAAVGKLAEPAVRDAYDALKGLIARKLGSQSKVATAVAELEERPSSEGRRSVLSEEVAATNAHQDQELIHAAQEVLARLAAHAGSTGVVQQVTGDRNIFSGSGDVHVVKP